MKQITCKLHGMPNNYLMCLSDICEYRMACSSCFARDRKHSECRFVLLNELAYKK